jgi:hypothetical protein
MSDEELIDRLEQVPERLARALAGDAAQRPATGPEGWSAVEILAHVRASDDIIAYRAYAILARDNPPLPAYDDRRWAEVTQYLEVETAASLAAFAAKRAELVRVLRHVAPADWERQGVHEVNGPLTLRQVVAFLLEHDEEHCAQLEALR